MAISVSKIAQVITLLLSSGGESVAANCVMLTTSAQVPIGAIPAFSSAAPVGAYFGLSSTEYSLASVYFGGYQNSLKKPGRLYFWQYNTAAVAAYARGASTGTMTLTQLQVLTGTLTVTVDGVAKTSSGIVLTGATSFSNAATIMQTAFTTPNFVVTYDPVAAAFKITSSTTGAASTISAVTGTLASSIMLSASAGAVLSQGAIAATPAGAMNAIKASSAQFYSFMLTFEPATAIKLEFAAWNSLRGSRYIFFANDSSAAAKTSGDTATLAPQVVISAQDGTCSIFGTMHGAAWGAGSLASIDFNAANSLPTFAFKTQPGISSYVPVITSDQDAENLGYNGYNYFGEFETDASPIFYDGRISGQFKFLDDYIGQIWLQTSLQRALLGLLKSSPKISYHADGYSSIKAALQPTILKAKAFGAISAGVSLNEDDRQKINQLTGRDVAQFVATNGHYLLVADPGTDARQQRLSPVITLVYASGGGVHNFSMQVALTS